jgi:uncharacterized membrane protein
MKTSRFDRGSMNVEAVLLAPVLVLFVLFVVHLGRLGAAQTRLIAAADHAARAASLVHPRNMAVAVKNLVQNGVSCDALDVRVDVVNTIDPGIVRVVIDCVVDNGGLNLLGPVPRRLSASSVEVIDRWRVDS